MQQVWACFQVIHIAPIKPLILMKRILIITAISIGAIIAIVPIAVVVFYAYGLWGFFITGPRQLAAEREFLLKKIDHQAVAMACLDLIVKPEFRALAEKEITGVDSHLPAAIRAVKSIHVLVSSNYVLLETWGYMVHDGLVFRPAEMDSNMFNLVFSEDGSDKVLYSLHR